MDITTFLQDNNFSSPLFFFTTIFLLLLVLKQIKLFCYKSDENLPPGPTKLPIIRAVPRILGAQSELKI
ncbi:hypothetical protein Hanom_Chr07g00580771 [Helianthus anomalus]